MPYDLICSGKERPETPLYAGTEQREEISDQQVQDRERPGAIRLG